MHQWSKLKKPVLVDSFLSKSKEYSRRMAAKELARLWCGATREGEGQAFEEECGLDRDDLSAETSPIIAAVQVCMLLVFMSHMNRVIANERPLLDAYETDEEVAARDAETAAFNEVLARVGSYDDAPVNVRRLLKCGAVAYSYWSILNHRVRGSWSARRS